MDAITGFASAPARRDVAVEGEHPDVVLADVIRRTRPAAKVVVVANEKGGVGKSTIAFHLAVALADAGLAVTALDLDRRQQTLSRAIAARSVTARRLGAPLPMPRHAVLHQHSGAMLCQELCRIGWNSEVIIVDAAGHDSAIARRAIAIADTLVTPVNCSFLDLDLIGRIDPADRSYLGAGCFARTVDELREARRKRGLSELDWVLVRNRLRKGSTRNQQAFEAALGDLAGALGFRLGAGLVERVAYRELFLLGLTQLDLRHIPQLPRARAEAMREILALTAELAPSLRIPA